jgi:serine phosphatase RsbU (regulator of sigma subunit)
MDDTLPSTDWSELLDELRNFEEIARLLKPSPGEIPHLPGVDIHGLSLPLRGPIGGDHIVYIDFDQRYDLDARIAAARAAGRDDVARNLRRNRQRTGVLLADVAGHRITDALVASMLHQAFLLGVYYELDMQGEVTTRLFEHLKTRFYESTSLQKLVTLVYGEIATDGRFRFVLAGHPPPLVFSREFGRFVDVGIDRRMTDVPLGLLPSEDDPDRSRRQGLAARNERYQINEIDLLNRGDLLLLCSDGLVDHAGGAFCPAVLEEVLREAGGAPAAEICARIERAVGEAGPRDDDISFVVIRRD